MPWRIFQPPENGAWREEWTLTVLCESSRSQDPSGIDKGPKMETEILKNSMWPTGKERQHEGHPGGIPLGRRTLEKYNEAALCVLR